MKSSSPAGASVAYPPKSQTELPSDQQKIDFDNFVKNILTENKDTIVRNRHEQRANIFSNPQVQNHQQKPDFDNIFTNPQVRTHQQKPDFDNFVKKILTENKDTIVRNRQEQRANIFSNPQIISSGSHGSRSNSPSIVPKTDNQTILGLLNQKPTDQRSQSSSPLTVGPSAMGPASSALLNLLSSNSPKATQSPPQSSPGPASSALLSLLSKPQLQSPVLNTSSIPGTKSVEPTVTSGFPSSTPGIASMEAALAAARQGSLRCGRKSPLSNPLGSMSADLPVTPMASAVHATQQGSGGQLPEVASM